MIFFSVFFRRKERLRWHLYLRILFYDNGFNRSNRDTLNDTKKVGCSILKNVVVKC